MIPPLSSFRRFFSFWFWGEVSLGGRFEGGRCFGKLGTLVFFASWLLAGSLLWASEPLSAQDALNLAKNTYDYGDYPRSIEQMEKLLYPKPGRLQTRGQRSEAHKYLGFAYFQDRNRINDPRRQAEYLRRSAEELSNWIRMNPEVGELDPLVHPPPLVTFFSGLLRKLAPEIARLRQSAAERTKRKQTEIQIVTVRIEKQVIVRHPIVYILPLGIPQFVSGHTLKASLLLGGELIALGLNVTAYGLIYSYQIKEGANAGRFRREDIPTVERLQILQFTALGLLAGLVIYGQIDGWLHYKGRSESVLPVLPAVDPRLFSLPSALSPPHSPRSSSMLLSLP